MEKKINIKCECEKEPSFRREAFKTKELGYIDVVYCGECKDILTIKMDNFNWIKVNGLR